MTGADCCAKTTIGQPWTKDTRDVNANESFIPRVKGIIDRRSPKRKKGVMDQASWAYRHMEDEDCRCKLTCVSLPLRWISMLYVLSSIVP